MIFPYSQKILDDLYLRYSLILLNGCHQMPYSFNREYLFLFNMIYVLYFNIQLIVFYLVHFLIYLNVSQSLIIFLVSFCLKHFVFQCIFFILRQFFLVLFVTWVLHLLMVLNKNFVGLNNRYYKEVLYNLFCNHLNRF